MRKLVTIQRILDVQPIEGSDFIEKIKILGWQLVAKKGEFKINDLCCYFEIDSFLPVRPEFEFLRKGYYKKMADGKEGFVLRTAKFRGVISQGLALPISILVNFLDESHLKKDFGFSFQEGEEITEILGVVKYEPPIPACLGGIAKGYLPGYLTTDETRVQVLGEFLTKYAGQEFYEAEKVDGASSSYFIDEENNFCVGSRNLIFEYDETNSIWKYALENNIEAKLRSLPFRACLQGEIFGEGIQGNKYKLKGQKVAFFNIINLDERKYLSFNDFYNTIEKLELMKVPITKNKFILEDNMDELIESAKGKSFFNKDVEREGIVLRPLNEQLDASFDLPHSRVSFKVINPNFLLKYEE